MAPSEPHFLHVCISVRLGAIVPVPVKVVGLEFNPAFVERERVPEGANRSVVRDERQRTRDHAYRAHGVPAGQEKERTCPERDETHAKAMGEKG